MKVHNTLSGKKEEFQPLQAGKVGMYLCGPTVYDLGHLGHGRSVVSFDVIRKYLIYKGFQVKFVTNYTDIDDKMIKRAAEMNISVPQLAEKIIPEYVKDYGALGVMPGDVQPRATDYVKPMIELISLLEQKGYTYLLDDGVYFEVKKFAEYGKLSKQKLDELKSGARVDVKAGKRSPQDFVLWKFSKPGEPKWDSPWGEGRPGWHIECSAMSRELLGETFDIHGGGMDLIFPHHECEIAQSESAYEKPFAKYWLHNGFINIDKEKMSKSLGNFFTIRDVLQKYPAQAVRLLFLQTHYRSPIEFSDDILGQAKNGLARIQNFVKILDLYYKELNLKGVSEPQDTWGEKYLEDFEYYMDDDFDTPGALGTVFSLISQINSLHVLGTLTKTDLDAAVEALKKMHSVLGIIFIDDKPLNHDTQALIQEREDARKAKDWKRSDEIRDHLFTQGIILEDTPKGTVWKRG